MPVTANQDDDDTMPSDFIGRAQVHLDALTHDKLINQEFPITNYKNKQVGSIHITDNPIQLDFQKIDPIGNR